MLLDNAVKFTERGGISLRVQPAATPPAGVEFALVDTGCGIAPERLEKLKSPFAQMDGSLARNAEGLGLGLTLAKALLKLMGSALQIESQPGRGSTFLFTIPVVAGSRVGPHEASPPERKTSAQAARPADEELTHAQTV